MEISYIKQALLAYKIFKGAVPKDILGSKIKDKDYVENVMFIYKKLNQNPKFKEKFENRLLNEEKKSSQPSNY